MIGMPSMPTLPTLQKMLTLLHLLGAYLTNIRAILRNLRLHDFFLIDINKIKEASHLLISSCINGFFEFLSIITPSVMLYPLDLFKLVSKL